MVKMVQNGLNWSKKGPKWSKMVKNYQNGEKWSKMVEIVQIGLKWSKMVKMFKNCQNGKKRKKKKLKMVQNGTQCNKWV